MSLIALLALAVSCGDDDGAEARLTIWAASSLTDVLPEIAAAFVQSGNGSVETTFSFDGSSRLARQIEAGAPADLFVSADGRWMDYLAERERIVESTRVDLLENRLVVVVPKERAEPPADLRDLATERFARIAVAGEQVPAGRYAEAALRHHGVLGALAPRFVRASNVRGALAYAAAGEVDAAIVYRSDAIAEPRVREAFAFDEAAHPAIVYPAAVTRHAAQAEMARHFLEFARSDRARAIFREAGFEVPGPEASPR